MLLDPLVDVYALGAILYELLTGRPPFRGESLMQTLHQVIHEDVVPPSHHQPRLDRDLETICLKCLAKHPQQRYGSALALAQDLERYQAGEPILGRRESPLRRLGRKVRRNLAAVAAMAVLLPTLAVAAFFYLGASTTRQVHALSVQVENRFDKNDWSTEHRARLEELLAQLERLDTTQAAALRQRLYEQFEHHLVEHLHAARLTPDDIEQLEKNIGWLAERDRSRADTLHAQLKTRLAQWQEVFDLQAPFAELPKVFDAALVKTRGRHLDAVPLPDMAADPAASVVPTQLLCRGAVQLEAEFDPSWQQATEIGLALNHQQAHRGSVHRVVFSPDGKRLYSAGQDRTVRIWEVDTGRVLRILRDFSDPVGGLAISPDGKVLATATHNGILNLWDAADGRKLATATHYGAHCLTFSRDGKQLASGSRQKTAAVWATDKLQQIAWLEGFADPVAFVAFGPAENTLTTVTHRRTVTFWDLTTRKPRAERADSLRSQWKAFALTPDLKRLALAGTERNLLCDTVTGREIAPLNLGPHYEPGRLQFSENGRLLACAVRNTIKVVPLLGSDDGPAHLIDQQAGISDLAFAPSGGLLALGLTSGNVVLWDVQRKAVRLRLGGRGYDFVLASILPAAAKKDELAAALPFAVARAQGMPLEMRIVRNGVILQRRPVQLPAAALHLLARRVNDLLEFQINGGPRLVFHDVLPLPASQGSVFGVRWPSRAQLTRLRATAQLLPPVSSPLEQADEFFASGRFTDALALYQQQMLATRRAEVRQEAQCKAGLCLVQLNRLEEALQQFGPVAAAPGERWPLIAVCQLWLLHLQLNRLDEMDALLANVTTRFSREQLLAYVPAQVQLNILKQTIIEPNDVVMFDPTLIRRGEQTLAVAKLFPDQDHNLYWGRFFLARLYCMADQEDKALPLLDECLQEVEAALPNRWGAELIFPLRLYTWLLRRQGQAEQALERIDRCLFDTSGQVRRRSGAAAASDKPGQESKGDMGFLPLYLDRARAHAALGQWEQAEQDLDQLFPQIVFDYAYYYQFYASCLLMKGFLCERRGDAVGAKQAWQRGLYSSYKKQMPPQSAPLPPLPIRDALLQHLIMAPLSEELSDTAAEQIFQHLLATLGDKSFVTQVANIVRVQPGLLREMWQAPRGRDLARRMAFLDLAPRHYFRYPLYQCATEKFRRDVLGNQRLSPEQEELLWTITHDLAEAMFDRRLSKTQVLQLGLTYKGTTSFLGWGGVAGSLPADLKAKSAYLFGLRFESLQRRAEAVTFFRTALANAPAGSPLQHQAQLELKRLQRE